MRRPFFCFVALVATCIIPSVVGAPEGACSDPAYVDPALPDLPNSIPAFASPFPSSPLPFTLPAKLLTPQEMSRVVTIPVQQPIDVDASAARINCPHTQPGLRNWHDPATWANGLVPGSDGESVTLPQNTSILLSSCSLPSNVTLGVITIPASSQLVFADANISIRLKGMIVDGTLSVGGPFCRLRSFVTIELVGTRPVNANTVTPPEYTKGIAAIGTLDIHGVEYAPTWTRLASSAVRGDVWIFAQQLLNWEVGQDILIVTTAYKDARDFHQNEVRQISELWALPSTNFTAIRINAPLNFSHYASWEYQTEVALLSRRVIIRGAANDSEPTDAGKTPCSDAAFSSVPCPNANLTGFGGHVMVRGMKAVGRIAGVLLYRMGQTNVLGRYPAHFHMLGDNGAASFLRDSSIWHSYYRCVSIHGTMSLSVLRNVAHDATGHCYYLEDGVEERNVLEHNLASLVHVMGYPASQPNSTGQYMPNYLQTPDLVLPADVTASGFYITNANNVFTGNSASGGWSGFAFPGLPAAIGLSRNSSFSPQSRPWMTFEGNTAHSSGYWWGQAGCIYVGGELKYVDANSSQLTYNPGRIVAGRTIVGGPSFMRFNNTKVFLCNVGLLHWGQAEEIIGFEAHDVHRSVTIFGQAYVTNMLVTCRTPNVVTIPGKTWFERSFINPYIAAFQWYDTGQMHIVTNITFRNCTTDPSRRMRMWELLTHSDQFLPDFMQASARVRYEMCSPISTIGMTVTNPDTTSGRLQNWLDADGTTTSRFAPTIIGSVKAAEWWRLDPDCIRKDEWYMWLCDKAPNRNVASFVLDFDPLQNSVGVTNCSNGDFMPCPPLAYAAHIGYNNETNGLPVTLNGRITGPSGGFGWYIRFAAGTPRRLAITSLQMSANDTLFVVLPYPPNTAFNITAEAASWCNPAWCRPSGGCMCSWTFRRANSTAEVRSGPGDLYFFDGQYLTIRVTQQRDSNIGVNGRWGVPYIPGFIREGIEIPARNYGYKIVIQSNCSIETGGLYCPMPTLPVPQSPCPPGQHQYGYDKCIVPSPSPTASVTFTGSGSFSSTAAPSPFSTGTCTGTAAASATFSPSRTNAAAVISSLSSTVSTSMSESIGATATRTTSSTATSSRSASMPPSTSPQAASVVASPSPAATSASSPSALATVSPTMSESLVTSPWPSASTVPSFAKIEFRPAIQMNVTELGAFRAAVTKVLNVSTSLKIETLYAVVGRLILRVEPTGSQDGAFWARLSSGIAADLGLTGGGIVRIANVSQESFGNSRQLAAGDVTVSFAAEPAAGTYGMVTVISATLPDASNVVRELMAAGLNVQAAAYGAFSTAIQMNVQANATAQGAAERLLISALLTGAFADELLNQGSSLQNPQVPASATYSATITPQFPSTSKSEEYGIGPLVGGLVAASAVAVMVIGGIAICFRRTAKSPISRRSSPPEHDPALVNQHEEIVTTWAQPPRTRVAPSPVPRTLLTTSRGAKPRAGSAAAALYDPQNGTKV